MIISQKFPGNAWTIELMLNYFKVTMKASFYYSS